MVAVTKNNHLMDQEAFLNSSIPELVQQLTVHEKISLLGGKDWWHTVPIPRLNIPSIKVSDGPAGARGGSSYNMTPATSFPNATCIGATFNRQLVSQMGEVLARETHARGAVCLLAPTINIQRSPLGGRAFESFSEDPTLSGELAASYVNGLQSSGVSATIKHFVCNDQEHERMGQDSIVSARALREVYLRPFQIAQAKSKPWAYMTSYNKLNGVHCSENEWLLQEILRKEWGHKGLIMSDWFGTYGTDTSINAGLNLEMPGPVRWRTDDLVIHLLNAHKIGTRRLDIVVGELLSWVQQLARINKDLVYREDTPEVTRWDAREEDSKVVGALVDEGIVLLKNEDSLLPVRNGTVAVIGPNVKARVFTGGGSARILPSWSSSPWEGLTRLKPSDVELQYSLGCQTSKLMPVLDDNFTGLDGGPLLNVDHFYLTSSGAQEATPFRRDRLPSSEIRMNDFFEGRERWITEVQAIFTAPFDGDYEFGLVVTGTGALFIDDKLLIDNTKDQIRGDAFYRSGTIEKRGVLKVTKGQRYHLKLEHDSRVLPEFGATADTPIIMAGLRLGARPLYDEEAELEQAASIASNVDKVILVVGLNADWESEGHDRPNLKLPLRTNELISRVSEANANVAVVLQGGSAVGMPWLPKVKAVVQAWYGGGETGMGIARCVYGVVNPSGRLPLTLPRDERDIAAHLNYKSANTKVQYAEGIWVGYKHFAARGLKPLFAFGHGLSYTTFDYKDFKVVSEPDQAVSSAEWLLEVAVTVVNTGNVAGSHSVHVYTFPPLEADPGYTHPLCSLQAFTKTRILLPGQSQTVSVSLDKYAISHWDDRWNIWRAEPGEWHLKIGIDAQTFKGDLPFKVERGMEWSGL